MKQNFSMTVMMNYIETFIFLKNYIDINKL